MASIAMLQVVALFVLFTSSTTVGIGMEFTLTVLPSSNQSAHGRATSGYTGYSLLLASRAVLKVHVLYACEFVARPF